MGILDFFTHEAGQKRRKWLNAQDKKVSDAANYYLGPTGIPDRAGLIATLLNPVEGVEFAMDGGRQAWEGEGWDRVAGVGNMMTGIAGTVAPGVAAGRLSDDAARALQEMLVGLGYMPKKAVGDFVADEAGSVGKIRAYHGSPHDFEKFDLDESMSDALWFSNDKGYAEGLAGRTNLSKRNAGHVYEVNINAKNPLVVDVAEESRKLADDLGIEPEDAAALEAAWRGPNYESALESYMGDVASGGHDALIFRNTLDGYGRETDQIATFSPELIEIIRKYGIAAAAPILGMTRADIEAFQSEHGF